MAALLLTPVEFARSLCAKLHTAQRRVGSANHRNTTPWCPEFDGQVRCSSIQTGVFAGPLGSSVGQHRFHPAYVVREEQDPIQTYTPHYGYFELRAKALKNAINHISLWMIGYEDAPKR